mgnify:CR=1 FL=1
MLVVVDPHFLERAVALRPVSDDLRTELISTLLDAGCVRRAARLLQRFGEATPLLRARVLLAQGRTLEALDLLDQEIAETKKRLPAHSVKPPVMMDLLTLEDEYDDILRQIQERKGTADARKP